MKDWKKDLSDFYEEIEKKKQDMEQKIKIEKPEVEGFYSSKVIPAFKELKTELEKHGREVELLENIDLAIPSIIVRFKGKEEYSYSMRVKISQDRVSPRPFIYCTKIDGRSYPVKSSVRDSSRMSDISKEDIILDFLGRYKYCLS